MKIVSSSCEYFKIEPIFNRHLYLVFASIGCLQFYIGVLTTHLAWLDLNMGNDVIFRDVIARKHR